MNDLFWLLTSAHLIADFPLQTDSIFSLKWNYSWGVLGHITIHLIVAIIGGNLLWNNPSFWLGLGVILLTHALIDKSKIAVTKRVLHENFLLFIFDQSLHILIIYLVAKYVIQLPVPFYNRNLFSTLFLDQKFQIILSAMIFAIFGGAFIIYHGLLLWERILPSPGKSAITFPPFFQRLAGYLERFLSMALLVSNSNLIILIPVVFFPRLILYWDRPNQRRFLILNFSMGIMITLSAYLFIFFLIKDGR